jgi:hypothetical protein
MPVTDDQALKLAEIEVMRSIQRAIDTTGRQVEALTTKMEKQSESLLDVRERLIRIEEGRYGAKVEELEDEVNALKLDKARREGAVGLVEWFGRNWLILLIIFSVAALLLRAGGRLPI